MNVELAIPRQLALHPGVRRLVRRSRRSERSRLARHDVVAARLAELHSIRLLLEEAITVVSAGWVQHGWFAVTDDEGRQHRITAHNLNVATGTPVSAACVVGSIVSAAGGPRAVQSQLVQRTLDLTWHALYEGEGRPVRWCPAPAIRAAHVRDLTRWNDDVERNSGQVTALLHTAVRIANRQTDLLRQAGTGSPPEDTTVRV